MPKHGKRYRTLYEQVDRERNYAPADAIALVKGFQTTKFSETVEAHIRTGLNVRHADEQLRGTISLPNGLGREQKIVIVAKDAQRRGGEGPGADMVGHEDLAKEVEE